MRVVCGLLNIHFIVRVNKDRVDKSQGIYISLVSHIVDGMQKDYLDSRN